MNPLRGLLNHGVVWMTVPIPNVTVNDCVEVAVLEAMTYLPISSFFRLD
jgi:hypothetical protein